MPVIINEVFAEVAPPPAENRPATPEASVSATSVNEFARRQAESLEHLAQRARRVHAD